MNTASEPPTNSTRRQSQNARNEYPRRAVCVVIAIVGTWCETRVAHSGVSHAHLQNCRMSLAFVRMSVEVPEAYQKILGHAGSGLLGSRVLLTARRRFCAP